MKEILLSICIPTYNRRELLQAQLENIYTQLEGHEEIEVIVSVNPGKDDTEEFVKKFSQDHFLKVNINNENIGGMQNIIKAVSFAEGKYIWVVSDDDELLEGLIEKILGALHEYNDIAWLHINAAAIDKSLNASDAKIIDAACYRGKGGYYKNGKEKIKQVLKEIDGCLLFSTSNIFFRENSLNIMKQAPKENMCSLLTAVFASAAKGAAYIIEEAMILEGGECSWKDQTYNVSVRYYNEALLNISAWGYTKEETIQLVKHRMSHAALYTWLYIVINLPKHPKEGLKDLKYYYKLMPALTVLMTIFSPLIGVYIYLRHKVRNIKRRKYMKKIKDDINVSKKIREKIY